MQGSPVCEGEDELSHSVHSQSMTAKRDIHQTLPCAVLKVGDRLHTVLTSALGNVGQRLSFAELQTAIQKIGVSQCLTFPGGIITGDIFSAASCLPFVTLEEG